MKKYIPHVLMVCLYTQALQAQTLEDALRYTRPELKGSARYVSMGGAFHALGGDLAAVKDNPAAAAVFLNSEIGATLNNLDNQIDANYYGRNNTVNSRAFNIEQFGLVLVLNDTQEGDFIKLAFAYNYQNERIFDNKYNAIGTNTTRGLDDYFLAFAQEIPFRDIKTYDDESIASSYQYLGENIGFGSQQAFLGYQGYLINPVQETDGNQVYVSNSNPQNQAVDHDFLVTQSGKNTKHTFTLSAQYQEQLYLGFNLNTHTAQYRKIDNLVENNYGSGSAFNFSEFENDLITNGEGFSFQLGAIYKPTTELRISLSYQSPIWYNFTDELLQKVISSRADGTDTIDPQIVNLYQYQWSTPAQYSGGMAYIFGNKGLISFQYDRANYQKTTYDIAGGDENFITQNKRFQDELQSAGTLRLGGEYRFNQLSLRAGYYQQQSLNKSRPDTNTGYSGGLGYDFGASKLDLALYKTTRNHQEPLYPLGLTDPIALQNEQLQFLVSYTLKL